MTFLDTWATTTLQSGEEIGFRSNFARRAIRTSATTLDVTGVPGGGWTTLAVYVNRVFNQTITYSGSAGVPEEKEITLPAGDDKLVEIVEIGEGELTAFCELRDITGTFTEEPASTVERRLVVLADSIGTGFGATPRSSAWNSLLRYSQSDWRIATDAKGGRQVRSMVTSQANIDNMIARLTPLLDGSLQNVIWVDLQTNDYFANRSAATHAADVATLCEVLETAFGALPSFRIVLSSMVSRTGEDTPNGGGATGQDLRDEMEAVALARGHIYNDGSTVLIDPDDLGDGVHPNTSGHVKKLTRAEQVLELIDMTISHGTATRTVVANTVVDRVDAGAGAGKLVIRDGATVLVTVTLADPAFDDAAAGVAALLGVPLEDDGTDDGDADNFLCTDSDDNTIFAGSVTATGGGGDLTLDTVTIGTGNPVTITGGNYTAPP